MKILAIDTATENCSAALLIGAELRAREELLPRGAAERILPMVQELLAEAGVTLGQLDAVAFGRGPGGFTGVRLAASITQGLAFGATVPVVPVSNLRALAQRALDLGDNWGVLTCADARMKEVYWACYARGAAGRAELIGEEHVGAPAAVRLPPQWADPAAVAGAGTGFAAYPELTGLWAARLGLIHGGLLPRAREIAALAAIEAAAGRVVPAEGATPVYLRDDVARAGPSH